MKVAIAALVVLLAGPVMAQQHQHKQHLQEGQSPYAGLQQRSIKALDDQQVSDLRLVRGLALSPAQRTCHQLAGRPQLSAEQRLRFRQLTRP